MIQRGRSRLLGSRKSASKRPPYIFFLAVLPKYRTECIRLVREHFGADLQIFISDAHLDPTVKSGIPEAWAAVSPMIRFGQKAFIQRRGMFTSFRAQVLVVDLNPRSISAWMLLFGRRVLGKKTLVWGHIHPRAGANSRTAKVRMMMRKLASSTISYTYEDAEKARNDVPGQPVYVAPNAVYKAASIFPAGASNNPDRNRILYVGRIEPEKKPGLLIEAFLKMQDDNIELPLLTFVGDGSQREFLQREVQRFGLGNSVEFLGWIDDWESLRSLYAEAFCSASPGFAGLGLTQSLGFGIPMVVAMDEPHSPEIELAKFGGVRFFQSDDASSLAMALLAVRERRTDYPMLAVSESVRINYSAETMSAGLISAIKSHGGGRLG